MNDLHLKPSVAMDHSRWREMISGNCSDSKNDCDDVSRIPVEGLRDKNRISSTSMKLRKSLVKPLTWQNISSCLVLPPEIIMHDALNVIL